MIVQRLPNMEGLKVSIVYLSFQATVGSVIAPETYKYYIEVSVWLLVELLATRILQKRERGRIGPHLEMVYTQVLGIDIVNPERE